MFTEKQIELTAKMYRARKAVKALIGEERFQKRVEEFRPYLEMITKKKGSQMLATIEIMKTMGDDGHARLLALAACVEIMAPSM